MNRTASKFFKILHLLFDETSRTFRNILQFSKLSTWRKQVVTTKYGLILVHLVTHIIRMLSLMSVMGNVLAMKRFHDNQPLIYFFEKYFIKGDAYVLAAFVLILLPWAVLSYYVAFLMGDYFRDLLVDVRSILECKIEWKTFIKLVVSGRESLSIQKRVSKAIPLLEQTCQGLNFRYNPNVSGREKAWVTFIIKINVWAYDFAYFLLKMETVIVPFVLVINLPEPLAPHLSLLNAIDLVLITAQVYMYIRFTLLIVLLSFFDGVLSSVSIPASYRRFRRLVISGSAVHMLYPAMLHHQRLFVNAANRLIMNNRKLVPYALKVQFFSAVTAITALLASMTMTRRTGSAGEALLLLPMIGMISGMFAFSLGGLIFYSKFLYRHAPLVIISNVRLTMVPRMLTRKIKGNTFVEMLNIRKKIAISLPFVGRITSKSMWSCLVVYSSLFLSFVQNYY